MEDDKCRYSSAKSKKISIHVLRVEDDRTAYTVPMEKEIFQSTSSVWRTTRANEYAIHPKAISIHVLRVEDDPPR